MEELIDIMNQLQDVFSKAGLHEFDLPQIAVVGTQSSGKSSVLEHLVGRSFLPRGPGVMTRCPLVLQLVNSQGNAVVTEDYTIFQHKKTELFKDYQMVKKEIEDETERLAGGEKGICSTPIFLTMYSRMFTNLTLVDLPGITKIPVGSQPDDIELLTKELILSYIERPNCIILVVTPANADMATCEGLKMAREVDPKGVRTLAVVTKLDLMDQGTDARTMLSGNVIPVKLGIIGVVNRSQKDILENKSMTESLKDEEVFFRKNYKELKLFHGTPHLTSTIQTILIDHIQQCLPELSENVSEKLKKQRLELAQLGDFNFDGPTLLLDLISKFSTNFCASINGTLHNIDTKELNGGARISNIFSSTNIALENIDPLNGLSENEIGMALKNAYGINITCFIPKLVFEHLVKKQIKQLHRPCMSCVDLVYKDLIKVIKKCLDNPELQLYNYPKLHANVSATALDLLESHLQITRTMVNHILDIHVAYINYNHKGFLPSQRKDKPSAEELNAMTNADIGYYKDIFNMIKGYFSIVRGSVMDMLPKLVMCYMVKEMMNGLNSELMSQLYSSEDCDLLQESPEILVKRSLIKNSILALEKADCILNSLNSSHASSNINPTGKITSPTVSSQRIKNQRHSNQAMIYTAFNMLFLFWLLFTFESCFYY